MFQDTRSITRRDAIKGLSGAGATLAALMVKPTIAVAQRKPYEVGYGLYGMRDLPYMEGLGHIARIGYKHAEITLRSGWNTEPRLLTRANRAEFGNGSAIWGSRSSMSWRGCSPPRTSRSSRISSGCVPPRRWRTRLTRSTRLDRDAHWRPARHLDGAPRCHG